MSGTVAVRPLLVLPSLGTEILALHLYKIETIQQLYQ